MVICDLACAVVTALLALPGVPVPLLLALVVLLGCFTPVFGAARASTLPDLLLGDQYVVGQALLSVIGQSSQLLGYAVGAGVLSVVGPRPALVVDAVSFCVSAAVVRYGTPLLVPHAVAAGASMARESLRGVRTLLGIARVRSLMVLGWVAPMFGVVPESLAVPYSSRAGDGATGAALMLGATAAGVIVGELVIARAFLPSSRVKAMAPLALWISLPPLLFVLHPSVPVAAALMCVSGAGWAFGLAQSQLLLEAMPEPLRRRGLSTATSGMMLTQALGFFAGGAMAEWLAPQDVIVLGGLAGLVVVSSVLLSVRRCAPAQREGVTVVSS
jgi:hypothetical protein